MAKGTHIQTQLDEFNSIILNLQNLKVEIADEDKTILFVVSLPCSYKHFKEILLYNSIEVLSYEDLVLFSFI